MSQVLAIIHVKGHEKEKNVNLFSDMACGRGEEEDLNGIFRNIQQFPFAA